MSKHHPSGPYPRPLTQLIETRVGWINLCPVCESEFLSVRSGAKTCSPKCRQRLYEQRRDRAPTPARSEQQ